MEQGLIFLSMSHLNSASALRPGHFTAVACPSCDVSDSGLDTSIPAQVFSTPVTTTTGLLRPVVQPTHRFRISSSACLRRWRGEPGGSSSGVAPTWDPVSTLTTTVLNLGGAIMGVSRWSQRVGARSAVVSDFPVFAFCLVRGAE